MSEKVFNNPVLDRLAQSSYSLVRGLYPKDTPVVLPFAGSEKLSPLILAAYPGLMGSLPKYVEGSWYSPFDDKTKDRVDEVVNKGDIKTLKFDAGVWALMRDSSKYLGESLSKRLVRDAEDHVNTVIKAP